MTTFVYDCRNRLIQAGDTTYQYDAENYRIGMTKNAGSDNEVKITYVVDSGSGDLSQVLKSVETDKAGNSKVLYYYYGANLLVAQEEYKGMQSQNENLNTSESSAIAGTYLLYHFNNVGSTTAVTDEKGNIKYQYQYSPYGELIQGTYGQVAFLYNGQYGVASDDNGLYYMRARYYNIDIKRFINQDVVTGSIERSSSLNRYAYVEGNPVSYIDPFGLERKLAEELHTILQGLQTYFTVASAAMSVIALLLPVTAPVTGAVATICGNIVTGLGILDMALYFRQASFDYDGTWNSEFLIDICNGILGLVNAAFAIGMGQLLGYYFSYLGENFIYSPLFGFVDDTKEEVLSTALYTCLDGFIKFVTSD